MIQQHNFCKSIYCKPYDVTGNQDLTATQEPKVNNTCCILLMFMINGLLYLQSV